MFDCLASMPEEGAVEIIRRIRAGMDVETVLRQMKEADLLLPSLPRT